jgi:hypothetical protein
MVITILFLISFIINVLLIIGLRNLFSKIDKLEQSYLSTKQKIEIMYEELVQIDNMGLFEKDDYVGATFDGIKQLIQRYNEDI